MAENSRFLRALQRIADTARRINSTPRPTPTIQTSPSILTSLPEHKPLLPLLLSHDIPPKLARACADRFEGYATQLRSEAESKLAPYLVNGSEGQPATIYSIFLRDYNRTLQRWSQSILNAVLKGLKRDSVELRNWDVTYPAPLWLPLLPDPTFAQKRVEKPCILSSIPRPAHAFPTTYPPPLRPPSGVSPVEWLRTPAACLTPPSTAVDLDSLCNRFATSLIISETPQPLRNPMVSIFSPPVVAREEPTIRHSCPAPAKRKHSRAEAPRQLPRIKPSILPIKATKLRQLSEPPSLPLPSRKDKPTSRKASVPARVPLSRYAPASPHPSNSNRQTIPTTSTSLLNTPIACDQNAYPRPDPSVSLYPRPSPKPVADHTTHTPQPQSYSPTGPTTPPALLPDLFSEPIVAPSSPVHLSPESSLIPITDPFLQFQLQTDYLSGPYLVSAFNYGKLSPGHTTGGSLSKCAFDTPFEFDHLIHGSPALLMSDPLENNFFNTYTVS